MNCKEAQRLIDGYLDGELDLVRSMEVESHVDDCPACLRTIESTRALSTAIRTTPLRFDAPRELEQRMLSAVRKQSRSDAVNQPRRRRHHATFRLAFGAATAALVVMLGWHAFRIGPELGSPDLLVQEAVSSHVRSLQANHLFDVASTNQHTVKPWFNGRLDFSPPVNDLADKGFPLVGGRLDYLNGRPVAALVYKRRLHVINLFVWPAVGTGDSPGAQAEESIRGYNAVRWSRGGMTLYAVSDVNIVDLRQFARNLSDRTGR